MVHFVIFKKPRHQYILAIDHSQLTQRQIVEALAEGKP